MNAQQVRAIGAQRFELTWGKVWAIAGPVLALAGAVIVYLWDASGQWATVNLRLTQTEQAAKAAGEAAQEVRERLQTITSEAASDRRILLRLESKMDNLGTSQSARYPSASGPSFPPN